MAVRMYVALAAIQSIDGHDLVARSRAPGPDTYIPYIKQTMDIAVVATLSTFSIDASTPNINTRIVFPKPTNVTQAPELEKVYFATNKYSRKFAEMAPGPNGELSRVNLLYWDPEGVGYVSIRGAALRCEDEEGDENYWDGWDQVYKQGPKTSFYNLIRIIPDHIEFESRDRFHVDLGDNRTDWRPLTLVRSVPTDPWKII
ncbi:hypothetical protein AAMO2058_001216200 [Amorphochlora amoebiformis]